MRQQLIEQELVPEEWGGDTIVVEVAAPEGLGVDELLDSILLVADVLDRRSSANPKAPARAFVLESNLDPGRGPVVTVLVERGTLRVGDPVVAGGGWGRVRAMFDEHGEQVTEAGPSVPVEVLGLDDVPAGRRRAAGRARREDGAHGRRGPRPTAGAPPALAHPMMLAGGARLEDIFAMVQRGEVATLNLVLKADVQGSLEALTDALRKLDQEHDEVRLSFVHRGVGGITESDVNLASVSNATVIGFNVRPDRKARELAEHEGVELRLYEVIYQVLEDVQQRARRHAQARVRRGRHRRRRGARGLLASRGSARSPVASCTNGVITRGSKVRFLREGVVIWKGEIASLQAVQGRRPRGRSRASSAASASRTTRTSSTATSSRRTSSRRSPAPDLRPRGPGHARPARLGDTRGRQGSQRPRSGDGDGWHRPSSSPWSTSRG